MQPKQIDLEIIDILSEEPGTRNVPINLAHMLADRGYGDSDLDHEDRVSELSNRVNGRIQHVLGGEFLTHVGPSPRSGLYELSALGELVAGAIEEHGIEDEQSRLNVRAAIAGYRDQLDRARAEGGVDGGDAS